MIRPLPSLSALALAAAIGAGAIAQAPQLPGSANPARVTAGTYRADPGHTLVGWRVNHFGFNDYFGLFGDVTGTLTIDPADPSAAKVDVTVPVNPTVASAGLRDHLLRPSKDGKAPDFFGPSPAPARFVSRAVDVRGDGTSAVITGDLTLNGQTRPVSIAAQFTGVGVGPMNKAETIGFHGRTIIRRSDFGLAFGIPMVSDAVALDITAAFEKGGNVEPKEDPALGPDACGASKVQSFIGRAATPAVRSEIARVSGAKAVRWLYPDTAATMDYREDRLNVSIAKGSDTIRSVRCG